MHKCAFYKDSIFYLGGTVCFEVLPLISPRVEWDVLLECNPFHPGTDERENLERDCFPKGKRFDLYKTSIDIHMKYLTCQVINKGGISYKNIPFHRECFNCTSCSKLLAGEKFTSKDELPYCGDCYGELFAKRCCRCSRPITG